MNNANDDLSTKNVIVDNNVLSPLIVEAFQRDAHLKNLYKTLSDIYSKEFPIVVKVSPTEFKVKYSDKTNELVNKVYQEINFRQEQILSFYDHFATGKTESNR